MTKKIMMIAYVTYEPDPSYYPEGATIEEMADIDKAHLEEDHIEIFGEEVNIDYKIIES